MMASLPSTTTLSLHLSDRSLTPILSSSRPHQRRHSQTQAQALSSLTTTSISAFDSASRLGLGIPLRVMVESSSSGPVLLHSYINPPSRRRPGSRRTTSDGSGRDIVQQARDDMRPLTATTGQDDENITGDTVATLVNGASNNDDAADSDAEEGDEENDVQIPPLLIVTVVAPSAADIREARRAAAQLERTGRDFQRQWAREQEEAQQSLATADTEVDDG